MLQVCPNFATRPQLWPKHLSLPRDGENTEFRFCRSGRDAVTQPWQVRSDLSTPSLGTSRRQRSGIPNPGRGSQLGNAVSGDARSEGRAPVTSSELGAQLGITSPHTPADCRGTRSCSQSIPPHARVLSPRPHTGPQQRASGTDSGGSGSRPGHAPQVPIASNPRPPARLDRRKAFLWEPPGCHVRLPNGQSRLRAASSSFLAAHRPRLLRRPRPFPAAGPRVRGASGALPGRRALPGGRGGGAGAEAELAAEKEAAPG